MFRLSTLKIYVPSLMTIFNILCGLLIIFASIQNHYLLSIYLLMFACIFDFLDGYIARKYNTTSVFGEQLDSFADLISFGLAPVLMIYFDCVLHKMNSVNCLNIYTILFMYVVCACIRLAKFNSMKILHPNTVPEYYSGIPMPLAAICAVSTNILLHNLKCNAYTAYIQLCIIVMISIGMISHLKIKKYMISSSNCFTSICCIISLIFWPYIFMPLIAYGYIMVSIYNYYIRKI